MNIFWVFVRTNALSARNQLTGTDKKNNTYLCKPKFCFDIMGFHGVSCVHLIDFRPFLLKLSFLFKSVLHFAAVS